MSKLELLINRPLVAFDPANPEHRKHYVEFRKYGGWGKCPIRFICVDEHGENLVAQMERQMVDYYLKQEFKVKKLYNGSLV